MHEHIPSHDNTIQLAEMKRRMRDEQLRTYVSSLERRRALDEVTQQRMKQHALDGLLS